MTKVNIPNLFIVGTAKAGTTSLYHYLKSHPNIYMSPIKEPNFFGSDIKWEQFKGNYRKNTFLDTEKYFSKGKLDEKHIAFLDEKEYYLKLFENTQNFTYLGEASTSYLYSKKAAKEIHVFNPEAKIIIILREPIDRTLSHYFMDFSGQNESENDVLKALKNDYSAKEKGWGISRLYIELSLYYNQIKRYLDIFPRDQILILNYEDLKSGKEKIIKDIFDFLDLHYDQESILQSKKPHNQTLVPKNIIIKKLLKFKKIMPSFLIRPLKQKLTFLFNKKNEMKVNKEAEKFIADLVMEDWEKTKELK